MRKVAIIGACIGSLFLLSGCDDNTSKLTADQQFQLKQMEMQQAEKMRNQRHELEMARAMNPAPVIQSETRYVESEPQVIYRDVPAQPAPQPHSVSPDSYGYSSSNSDSGSGIGSHVATAAVGAAAGYYAGKYTSTPKGQQQVQTMKSKTKSMYDTGKKKAYTGYRFTKSKTTSAYRSFKKRK
ncbi:hypothetical protein ECO319P1_00027 [Escherichia phage ECO319P1]|nr:hypothetical protein ECO319P1_00027 [Escherichia phage ECO319P1]